MSATEPDYKHLFEVAPSLMLVLSPEFAIIAVTDAYLAATLTKRNEIIGRGLFDVFPDNPNDPHADGVANLTASLNRVLANKVPDVMPTQKYDVATADGSFEEKFWSPMNFPVLAANGAVTCIIHQVTDVTEFVQLRKKGTEYERLTGELQARAESMEGEMYLRAQQLQAANVKMSRANEELRLAQEELQSTNEEMQATQEELRVQQEELQELNTELTANNEALEKARLALLLKAEELERSSSFKTDFLSNMSHELRTPLNSMLILSKLLGNNTAKNLTPKQVEQASIIHKAGNDLLSLINDILDLSKIEAGKIEMVMEQASIADIRENVESIFMPLATQRDVGFSVNIADDVPALLYTDRFRLEQILKNLLSNAFKFTAEHGYITLLIAKAPAGHRFTNDSLLHTGRDIISLAVADTGIGIPKDKQADIFMAFRQADGSTSRKYGGTGLGLSISRQLAGLLGGEIQLQSEVGQGSIFTIYIPADPGNRQEGNTQVFDEANAVLPKFVTIKYNSIPFVASEDMKQLLHSKVILIADDDERNIIALQMVLEQYGCKLLTAANGIEALQLLREHMGADIVLTDIMMPEMDGFELIRNIRQNHLYKTIPIIALTAKAMKSDLEKCLEAGASDYLSKPIDVQQLLAIMEVWLRKDAG